MLPPIPLKLLRPFSIAPSLGSPDAAGFDVRYIPLEDTSDPVHVLPGEVIKLPLGFSLALHSGTCGLLLPRSGMALEGLRPANTPGLIDPDYRGEVAVLLENFSNDTKTIYPYTRVAQLAIFEFPTSRFTVTDELPETQRGSQGFGSTGKH